MYMYMVWCSGPLEMDQGFCGVWVVTSWQHQDRYRLGSEPRNQCTAGNVSAIGHATLWRGGRLKFGSRAKIESIVLPILTSPGDWTCHGGSNMLVFPRCAGCFRETGSELQEHWQFNSPQADGPSRKPRVIAALAFLATVHSGKHSGNHWAVAFLTTMHNGLLLCCASRCFSASFSSRARWQMHHWAFCSRTGLCNLATLNHHLCTVSVWPHVCCLSFLMALRKSRASKLDAPKSWQFILSSWVWHFYLIQG